MSTRDQITEADQVERLKKKVNRIYENYGIISTGMDEGDLAAVYRYYLERLDELDSDYKQSQAYAGKFDDDDLI